MGETFDYEERWPELFAPLEAVQRREVLDSLVDSWHEGFVADREHVRRLVDYTRGVIDEEEYFRQVRAAIDPGAR